MFSSPGARTETGTSDGTSCGSARSPLASRSARKPLLIAARTTSFTVPPNSRLIVLTSSNDARAHVYRRCLPMVPLSEDLAAGHRDGESLAIARAMPVAWAMARPGWVAAPLSARVPRAGSITASQAARMTSETGEGSALTARWSGTGGAGSGEGSRITRYRSVPEIPSTMQWCTLEISAQRSRASPSTTQYSHSG